MNTDTLAGTWCLEAASLERVFEQLPDGLVLASVEGSLLHWNRSALAMHGLADTTPPKRLETELGSLYRLETLDRGEVPFEQWPLARLLRGEPVESLTLRVSRTDRPFERIFVYDGTLIVDAAGRPEMAALHMRDVTARWSAEEALEREAQRQSVLLQCAQRLLEVHVDDDPLLTEQMQCVAEFLGADRMVYQRLVRSQRKLMLVSSWGLSASLRQQIQSVPVDDVQAYSCRVATTGQPLIADSLFIDRDPDGQLARAMKLRSFVGYPLFNQSGEVLGTLAFSSTTRDRFSNEDIRLIHTVSFMFSATIERAETERSLRLSEADLRQLAESMRERDALLNAVVDQLPIVVWSTDRSLHFTSMRGAALRDTPFAPERLAGGRVSAIDVPDREETLARHRAALAGQTVFYDVERAGRLLRGVVAPLYEIGGQIGGVVGMLLDISEHARAERALREAAENMAQAQRIAHFGSWELPFDDHGVPLSRELFWSDELYRIHGRKRDQEVIDLPRSIETVHPDDRERMSAALGHLSAEVPEWGGQMRIVRADGEVRHVRLFIRLFIDERTGRRRKMIGTVQDVTEQHSAAEEIRRLNADLERRVAERTAELEAANAELESFSYAVAHDLRAPLRAMAGFARALVEDFPERMEGEPNEYVTRIVQAADTMSSLIEALLELSRISSGEIVWREPVDVSSLAERTLRSLERTETERKVDWKVQPGLNAWGDARMVDVVLTNLLSNAWKYTARQPQARIEVSGEVRGEQVHVRVSDNGAGFSMDHAAKLFQPFQRLHRQDEFPGIGIGLATVQRIVRRHGGTVTAQGSPGHGASFAFSLPVSRDGKM